MNRESKLLRNTLIYAFGNISSKMIGFLLLPLYTTYLTVSEFGIWDIVTTTVLFLMPIIIFQLNDGIYRHILEENHHGKIQIVISTAMIVVLRNILVFTLGYLLLFLFIDFKYEWLVIFQICIMSVYEVFLQIIRGLKKNQTYAFVGIINSIAILVLNFIFLKMFHLGLSSLFISNILAMLISIIYIQYKINIIQYIDINFYDTKLRKELVNYSVPLIPNVISWWVMNLSDRYFIGLYLGTEANGLYAIANKLPTIMFLANSIFYLAWQESAIMNFNSNDRDKYYSRMFNRYMTFLISFSIVLLSFTKIAFTLLIDIKYDAALQYVPLLYLGTIFSAFSSFYGTGYHSAKDTRGAFTTSVYAAITNGAINLILIPIIGLQGASISTMLAFLVMWLLRIKQTKKYFNITIEIKSLCLLLSMFVIVLLLFTSNNVYSKYLSITIALITFLVSNKEILVNVVSKVKKKKSIV
ncbi:lipopolysaccharide biosynthesis protein [Neobacillus sp. BF23-41]|uniref:lipopolysaccharide biosynthesis protein n=1 Tax=Neobacillus sp. BF23-41 TaxID=3240280 RepID=UPI0034E5CA37